jgi:hypothetical protein
MHLWTYDAKCCVLERKRYTAMKDNDQVISAQCKGVVMARLESPLKVECDLVEPSPEAHPSKGLYMSRILVQYHWEVPARVLNATRHDQKHAKASPQHTVTTYAGHPTQCGTAGPKPYSEVAGRDCSGQVKPE